ncbi:MAG: DUF4349 domain-containing protein [Spirochaetes bacterium]|nr:DUF4349 domain-containing protein [Spirochaetota bacterium]
MKTRGEVHTLSGKRRGHAVAGFLHTRCMRYGVLLVLLFGVLSASGCGRVIGWIGGAVKSEKDASYISHKALREEPSGGYEEEYDKEMTLQDALAEKRAAPAVSEAVMEEPGPVGTRETAPKAQAEDRKRVYYGFLRLSVDSVEKKKEEIFVIAESFGGWVEQSAGNTVVVRVPAQHFEEALSTIGAVGEVIERSVETQDVTEQYQDLLSRLRISQHARERLYLLLARTDDVEERLKILREIRRLTDEIEELRQRLELLEKLVSYSRITVELVPRLAYESPFREMIPFAWIRNLDPVRVSIDERAKRAALELPGTYAVFAKEDAFRAESAEGVMVRLGSVPNLPSGDSLFWQRALEYHLEPFYAETEKRTLGGVECVLFKSKDRKPFYYLVGVIAEGKRLYVAETFFPTEEAFKKEYGGISGTISAFEVR